MIKKFSLPEKTHDVFIHNEGEKGQIATDHDSSSSDYAVKSVVLI